MFKKILIGTFGLAIAAIGVTSAPDVPEAKAACGCLAKYSACIATQVKPGNVVDGMQKCDDVFSNCTDACKDKKACKDECKDAKDVATKACEKAFDETTCKLGDNDCKKDARRDRAECTKEARKDTRACKKGCGE
jgi:hypothetical protein